MARLCDNGAADRRAVRRTDVKDRRDELPRDATADAGQRIRRDTVEVAVAQPPAIIFENCSHIVDAAGGLVLADFMAVDSADVGRFPMHAEC